MSSQHNMQRPWFQPRNQAEAEAYKKAREDVKCFLVSTARGAVNFAKLDRLMDDACVQVDYTRFGFRYFGEFLFHCQDFIEIRMYKQSVASTQTRFLFLKPEAIPPAARHLHDMVKGQVAEKKKKNGLPVATRKNTDVVSPNLLITGFRYSNPVNSNASSTRGSFSPRPYQYRPRAQGLTPQMSPASSNPVNSNASSTRGSFTPRPYQYRPRAQGPTPQMSPLSSNPVNSNASSTRGSFPPTPYQYRPRAQGATPQMSPASSNPVNSNASSTRGSFPPTPYQYRPRAQGATPQMSPASSNPVNSNASSSRGSFPTTPYQYRPRAQGPIRIPLDTESIPSYCTTYLGPRQTELIEFVREKFPSTKIAEKKKPKYNLDEMDKLTEIRKDLFGEMKYKTLILSR